MSALLKTSIIAHMVVFWSASDENVILEIFATPLLRITALLGVGNRENMVTIKSYFLKTFYTMTNLSTISNNFFLWNLVSMVQIYYLLFNISSKTHSTCICHIIADFSTLIYLQVIVS